MIKYYGGSFGLQIIIRLHGSAVFKSITPALLSTLIYLILYHTTDLKSEPILLHPYPIGALMVAFSFLLTFKMSFSYDRYWEACTAVHQMHSKWLDVGTEVASFHLQSNKYKKKPPAFGHHPEIVSIERERERYHELNREELEQRIEELQDMDDVVSLRTKFKRWSGNAKAKKVRREQSQQQQQEYSPGPETPVPERKVTFNIDVPVIQNKDDHARREKFHRVKSTRVNEDDESKQVSLFLQETAHLLSLLSAVAMSTLRNDLEGAESPLSTFTPNAPWPREDPDAYDADVRRGWSQSRYFLNVLPCSFCKAISHSHSRFEGRGFGRCCSISLEGHVQVPAELCTMQHDHFE